MLRRFLNWFTDWNRRMNEEDRLFREQHLLSEVTGATPRKERPKAKHKRC